MELIVGLIIFCIVGLAAGAIAAFYMGRQQDLWMNLLIGIIGAMVGGFIARLLGITAYNVVGEVVVATLGAILCLYVWQRVRGLEPIVAQAKVTYIGLRAPRVAGSGEASLLTSIFGGSNAK